MHQLKGRQIESTNNVEVAFNCGTPQLHTFILRNDWVRNSSIYLVSCRTFSFRANHYFEGCRVATR
jgi:hypothetical protein